MHSTRSLFNSILFISYIYAGFVSRLDSQAGQIILQSRETESATKARLIKLSTNGFPYIRLSYIPNTETSQVDFSFRVGGLRLVEYNDTVGIEESNSVCEFTDKGFQWWPFNVTQIDTFESVVANYSTTFVGRNECEGLVVGFDTFITANNTQVSLFENTTEQPLLFDEPRYVYRIYSFPYKLENSKLALVKAVFSEKERNIQTNRISTIQTKRSKGNFNFNGFAIYKNVLGAVNSSGLLSPDGSAFVTSDDGADPNESYNIVNVFFDAIQPDTVLWDPTMSITVVESVESSAYSTRPIISCILFCFIVAFIH